ncbi:MAG TPA: zf-TFIIB domain-containing protein [Roseiflexaceae bacterium]|nr:zf-TFIIB domain-containing protein [Roseiflexaceae bacterium]
MNCPVCSTHTLHTIQLEPALSALACANCRGLWIASTDYWAWLDQLAGGGLLAELSGDAPEVADVPTAKRCPGCGYLQLGYCIALDLGFALDQCGHCNSFWLDGGEWAALRQRGLHAQLHKVTGEAWQRSLRRAASRRTWEAIYTEKFGTDDYAEARRVKAWLQQHPARQMLLAYLAHEDPYSA